MSAISDILKSRQGKIAVLIDPDKTNSEENINPLIEKINYLSPAFIFVGGSTVDQEDFSKTLRLIKAATDIPVIIFPGGHAQIDDSADGILFLSLISGRNPDYLIGHQIESAHRLKKMDIEVIPTAYLLIDGGVHSSVSYVSQTTPIPADQITIAANTAIAGEMMGMKAVFLDAGSGAKNPVSTEMISEIRKNIEAPLIIGGGLKNIEDISSAFAAGADVIVIGNKIEEDTDFLLDLKELDKTYSTSG